MLQQAGYVAIPAHGSQDALAKSRDRRGEIHLLLTDIMMPEMTGLALARQLLPESPDMRVLLMSGYSATQTRLPLLRKPFTVTELCAAVKAAMAGPPPVASDIEVF